MATSTSTPVHTIKPGPNENRIHERVYLRDVLAQLPADTLVDVVGRGTYNPEGSRHYTDVEHVLVIDEDAYKILRGLSTLPRARGTAAATPRASGVTPTDLQAQADRWAERAERYERFAEEGVTLGMSAGRARQLAELCRSCQAEFDGLAKRHAQATSDAARKAA